jgi:hypothetical protein
MFRQIPPVETISRGMSAGYAKLPDGTWGAVTDFKPEPGDLLEISRSKGGFDWRYVKRVVSEVGRKYYSELQTDRV